MASKTEENRQVASDLRNKLKLEATFRPEVKRLFSLMLKDFTATVVSMGLPPPASAYRREWKALISNHHKRTQRVFSGAVEEQQKALMLGWERKQFGFLTEEEQEELIALGLLNWREENSALSSIEITTTNQKNFNQSIAEANQIIEDQELPRDNKTLALTAVALLRRKFRGRTEGIVSFETQSAAESTKQIEAEGLSERVEEAIKKWRTVGDDKVRTSPFNHRAANLQAVKLSENFIVSGELLRYAGDRSQGASIGNIANCRCSVQYSL